MSVFSSLKSFFSKSSAATPADDAQSERQKPIESGGTVVRPEVLHPSSRIPHPAKSLRVWDTGEVILDTYQVEDVKSGGMGYVYIVDHLKWKVKLAVKSPKSNMLADRMFFARVVREADAWIDLGLHPHIAYCYYVRQIEEVPHIFIEYVDGGNLREWITALRCYDLQVGLDLAIQFCHGMEHAHSHGMIHRDLKPENVLLTENGQLKVTDFGLAKLQGTTESRQAAGDNRQAAGSGDKQLTTFGTQMGTFDYMPPEQWESPAEADGRADIFAFGVCLYEMLCGCIPYEVASVQAAKKKIKPHEPAQREDLPRKLARLMKKCCALERDERYDSFEQVRQELVEIYGELFATEPPSAKLNMIGLKAAGLNNRAVSYLELGKEEAAERLWQEALAEDPYHLEAAFNLGYFRWTKAWLTSQAYLAQLSDLKNSHRTNPDYWRCLAWIHYECGDVEAVERIQQSEYRIEDEEFRRLLEDQDRPMGRLLKTLEGHGRLVNSVSFSPDGQYALSGNSDNTVRLWEVARSQEVRCFEGHTNDVNSVSFSPDGQYILSGSNDNTIRLWEVVSGQEVKRFEGHTRSVNSVSFSPDGQYILSGGWDKTIRLWEIASGQEVKRFEGHTDNVSSVSFSPDGRYALSGSNDKTVRLWEFDWEWEFEQEKVATAEASNASAADKVAAAKAFIERGNVFYNSGQPRLYKYALRDFRIAARLDPTNAEATGKRDQIIQIYQSINRPVPTLGEEP